MDKQAAKEEFLRNNYGSLDEQYCSHRDGLSQGFDVGYDEGYKAAGEWKAIHSADDLPKEDGEYIVTRGRGSEVAFRYMNVTDEATRQMCVTLYSAWRPKPEPFTEPLTEQTEE